MTSVAEPITQKLVNQVPAFHIQGGGIFKKVIKRRGASGHKPLSVLLKMEGERDLRGPSQV